MIGFVVLPLFVLVAIGMEVIAMRRCAARIDTWASINGVKVTSAKRLWLSTGTWSGWAGGRNRRYFNLTVDGPSGSTRSGTAKIWGGFGGVLADEIEVRWG